MKWTWDTVYYGEATLERDELVRIDDGTEGFVETVDLSGPVPRILVTRRKCGDIDLKDRWIIPAKIVG